MQWDKDGTSKMACAGLSPCHFNQDEGQAREETQDDCSQRKWKPAVCPFAERGEAKGAWESQMSGNGHHFAVI